MIQIHRAERADRLVDVLAGIVAVPADDALAPEVVAVASRGIERWLAQELATRLGTSHGRGDGVCANVEFPFPSRVVGSALEAATGVAAEADPWAPRRLVWPLLEVVDEHLACDWLAPLRAHLGGVPPDVDPTRRARRFPASRHIADLFDRYAVHRPAMVKAWAAGDDVDAAQAAIHADDAWQPRLWRLLRERVAAPSLAERLDDACARLRDGLDVRDLPSRLTLFGLTALPRSYVDVLAALGATRDVHLLLLHPSPALWDRVHAHLQRRRVRQPIRRADDPTRRLARHPLLASWGRDARELQLVAASAAAGPDDHRALQEAAPTTLLARVQAAVRADQPPPGVPRAQIADGRPPLDEHDRSLQFHACHGRSRQVEVLRDAILHLLADDPTLEPRDIVVMCPDIETFAPLVSAVFDITVAEGGGAAALPDLRVRLADRALRRTNPLLRVVAELLELAESRLTASQVLDLAASQPVRRRFRFDDDDLERLESWVADARIRWGLDARHRADYDLGGLGANTWSAGLDRILLGVAMADEDDRLIGGAAALDDVEGDDVDLSGRLAELRDRLAAAVAALRQPQSVASWRDTVVEAGDALTTTPPEDRWQRLQLHRVLDDAVAEADGRDTPLALAELRALLDDRLRGRPSRAGHRTGDLTVCTLVPMRSVPHRVICLLGMDDGAFPRRPHADGDDLVARDPHVGDRDPRTEDRQLLLDALLAATDALVVTYAGRDERTNEPRPPAVPIGELLDVVDRSVRTADGRCPREQVVVDHPLQPFDPRNFRADAPWGFDHGALAAARACRREPQPVAFLPTPLPPPDDAGDVIDLDALIGFVGHPVRAFLGRRLSVYLSDDAEERSDAIPVELTALERYQVGQRLLDARLDGAEVDRWLAAERARGVLPPGVLADRAVAEVAETVEQVLDVAGHDADLSLPPDSLEVDLRLADGRTLLGTVPGVRDDVVLGLGFARVGPKQRLAAWVRLLAAAAAHPGRRLRAVTVGRGHDRRFQTRVACITPRSGSPQAALRLLTRLVDLYDRGLREPLPLYCKTSAAYASTPVDSGRDPHTVAQKEWTARGGWGEDRDPAHVLCLGGVVTYDELVAEPPRADEAGPGWGGEPSRFARYARRLWAPVLELERIVDRE